MATPMIKVDEHTVRIPSPGNSISLDALYIRQQLLRKQLDIASDMIVQAEALGVTRIPLKPQPKPLMSKP